MVEPLFRLTPSNILPKSGTCPTCQKTATAIMHEGKIVFYCGREECEKN